MKIKPYILIKENSWNGTLDGTLSSPTCSQSDGTGRVKGQEDCLVVNIYKPGNVSGKKWKKLL